jgi:hypothetical protein
MPPGASTGTFLERNSLRRVSFNRSNMMRRQFGDNRTPKLTEFSQLAIELWISARLDG